MGIGESAEALVRFCKVQAHRPMGLFLFGPAQSAGEKSNFGCALPRIRILEVNLKQVLIIPAASAAHHDCGLEKWR